MTFMSTSSQSPQEDFSSQFSPLTALDYSTNQLTMGCLSSLEVPLATLITVIFLVNGLYNTAYKVIESQEPMDQAALDVKEMLMSALAIMSLIGLCSARRAFGVFTLLFMLHAFIFSLFHVLHTVTLHIKSSDTPCKFLKLQESPEMCHVIRGVTLVCNVISMLAAGLATMAVYMRLTTVVVPIADLRGMATSRAFDNSMPRLISRRAIESEREEDFPERKMGRSDLFV